MSMSTQQLTQKTINIRIDQSKYLEDSDMNFSGLVRRELDQKMEEEEEQR